MNSLAPPKQQPWIDGGLIILGLTFMYGPTLHTLNSTLWNVVGQGHGPIMLALAGWLAWIRKEQLRSLPDRSTWHAACMVLTVGVISYVLGRTQDILLLEVGSLIWVLIAGLLFWKGWPGVKVMWFPLFFLLFVIPLPGPIVDALTGPLKAGVSYVAEGLLYMAGYPVGRAGVTLTIGPYKLLVADACAGINSIFALEAIGVFYMSIMQHKNKLRNIMLAILILPISFVSNVIRVVFLVLITYYFGDAAGQGFAHDFAGIVLFMVATLLTILTDTILGLVFKNNKPTDASARTA